MPPMRSAHPRSPDFVRKQCSSQKPCLVTWAANEPASFQSFVMVSTLYIAPRYADLQGVCFHGVVASAELAAVEEHAQNFYVMLGGKEGDDPPPGKQAYFAAQGMQN